jgi:hypothetical protein
MIVRRSSRLGFLLMLAAIALVVPWVALLGSSNSQEEESLHMIEFDLGLRLCFKLAPLDPYDCAMNYRG